MPKLYRAHLYIYDEAINRELKGMLIHPYTIGYIYFTELEIIKETDKTYTVEKIYNRSSIIKKGEGHRYAYPTKEQAIASLKRRTERRLEYALRNKTICDIALGNWDKIVKGEEYVSMEF